jgi:hypothetical protein
MEKIYEGDSIHLYRDVASKSIVSFAFLSDREEVTTRQRVNLGNQGFEVMGWGSDNKLPQRREDILKDNNIVPELIATKRGITLGQGLICFNRTFKDGKKVLTPIDTPEVVKTFLDQSEWDDYILAAAGDIFKHNCVFTEYIRNKGGQIHSISNHSCKRMRAGLPDLDGKVRKWFWHGSWDAANKETREQKAKALQLYNPAIRQPLFITVHGDPLFFDGYYFWPPYWGGKEWIELSNIIPKFHKSNLTNGYTVRFHIEIPKGYFSAKGTYSTESEQKKALEEAQAREQEFIDNMNKFLSGTDNAGRAVYTKYDIEAYTNKEFPGIKIHPVNFDMKDEALLKLFEKSNQANIGAQGLHPTLASIETQGKLSSGSEMRNALNAYISIKTPAPRSILLKPLYLVKKINNWPANLEFGFEDMDLTVLSEDHAGTTNKVENQEVDE